jgi:hypothetical protein
MSCISARLSARPHAFAENPVPLQNPPAEALRMPVVRFADADEASLAVDPFCGSKPVNTVEAVAEVSPRILVEGVDVNVQV